MTVPSRSVGCSFSPRQKKQQTKQTTSKGYAMLNTATRLCLYKVVPPLHPRILVGYGPVNEKRAWNLFI